MFSGELTGRERVTVAAMDAGALGMIAGGYAGGLPFVLGLGGVTLLTASVAVLLSQRTAARAYGRS